MYPRRLVPEKVCSLLLSTCGYKLEKKYVEINNKRTIKCINLPNVFLFFQCSAWLLLLFRITAIRYMQIWQSISCVFFPLLLAEKSSWQLLPPKTSNIPSLEQPSTRSNKMQIRSNERHIFKISVQLTFNGKLLQ